MADIEKAIKGLKELRENMQSKNQGYFVKICDDAIELLKEQEHKDKMFHALEDDWKRLNELLKEQRAVIEKYHKADGFLEAHGWKWEG